MTLPDKRLVVLGCSATKTNSTGCIPAINLYDGPSFRVLRTFLRRHRWPDPLSIAVLSAKYGLIGGLAHIGNYNREMTSNRAIKLRPAVAARLQELGSIHKAVDLVMGQNYLKAISHSAEDLTHLDYHFVEGPIGMKLNYLHTLLQQMPHEVAHIPRDVGEHRRTLYFLPDWDDFVDADFNFSADTFSSPKRSTRTEKHLTALMRPRRICDGVLVSLAQHLGSKGLLKRVGLSSSDALAPHSVRSHFKLTSNQWAFGDCGAFSYASEDFPSITVQQAVYVYDLYEFDLGASVDHIPLAHVVRGGKVVALTETERQKRVRITRENAQRFMSLHREYSAKFIPVGVIQGIAARDYANQVGDYLDMGYRHLALGGLVPRADSEILDIVKKVTNAFGGLRQRPWLHLLGIFRPSLQAQFRSLGVSSFDSATYFRKAWLRSGQNYLASDGAWYAAIRVPPTSDARTLARLRDSGFNERQITSLETAALNALHRYGRNEINIETCLRAVHAYDSLLARGETQNGDMLNAYRRTLESQPWKKCDCNVCREIGIDVMIFRGLNRNKRRGAHNTLQLYRQVGKTEL